MINQEIIDFIQLEIKKGIPKKEIIKTLETRGWRIDDINLAFTTLEKRQSFKEFITKQLNSNWFISIVSILFIFLVYQSKNIGYFLQQFPVAWTYLVFIAFVSIGLLIDFFLIRSIRRSQFRDIKIFNYWMERDFASQLYLGTGVTCLIVGFFYSGHFHIVTNIPIFVLYIYGVIGVIVMFYYLARTINIISSIGQYSDKEERHPVRASLRDRLNFIIFLCIIVSFVIIYFIYAVL